MEGVTNMDNTTGTEGLLEQNGIIKEGTIR
jgi:hypothetical protein